MNLNISFDGLDRLQKQFGAAPLIMDRAMSSAIKSALFHVREKLKDAIRNNEFGWPQLKAFPTSSQIIRLLNTLEKGKQNPMANAVFRSQGLIFKNEKKNFFGKLFNAIFYSFDKKNYSGEVGAVNTAKVRMSDKAKTYWMKTQMGFTKRVDDRARNFFAAIGIPIRASTSEFKTPARPLFGPVSDKRAAEVTALIEMVIADKIGNGFAHSDMLDRTLL